MKRGLVITGATAAALAGAAVIAERTLIASPHYHGPKSDHFDGARFHNPEPFHHGFADVLKWQMDAHPGYWREWVDDPPGPRPPKRVDDLRITFVNHATTLIQINGLNILTDPIWSERCSPVSFAGPKRHRPPGIRFEDLPPIDVVLVSHNHYDHLDLPTLRALEHRDHPLILTPLGNSALMARGGVFGARDLDWWQTTAVPGSASPADRQITVTAVPSNHFCARALSDRNRTLWGGFVVSAPAGNVYFAGDTGWGPHFEEIARRFPTIRLALLPIGAYLPRWFMKPAHIEPEEAVKAHILLNAGTSMAMHYGTFNLGDDGELEPVEDLRRAISRHGNPRFWILGFGEGRDVP